MAAAIPFAIQAGSAIYSHYKNKKANKVQQTAMEGNQALAAQAPQLMDQGKGYLREAAQTLQPAAQYYQNILGSRQAATTALAPETTTALEYYRGAEGKTRRTMVGGARDTALAELDRQKVGQIAGLLPAARRGAAEGAGQIGSIYGGLGGQSMQGGFYAGMAGNNAFNQAQTQKGNTAESANAWGKLAADALGAWMGSRQSKQTSQNPWYAGT